MKYLLILLLGAFMALTNPSATDHREAVAEKFDERNPFASMVMLDEFYANSSIRYNDYLIFSTTHDQLSRTTIGAFGCVWVVRSIEL